MKVLVSNFNSNALTVKPNGKFVRGSYELSVREFEKRGNAFYCNTDGLINKYHIVAGHVNPNMGTDVFAMNHALPFSWGNATVLRRKIRGQNFFFALFDETADKGNVQGIYTLYRIPEKAVVEYK